MLEYSTVNSTFLLHDSTNKQMHPKNFQRLVGGYFLTYYYLSDSFYGNSSVRTQKVGREERDERRKEHRKR